MGHEKTAGYQAISNSPDAGAANSVGNGSYNATTVIQGTDNSSSNTNGQLTSPEETGTVFGMTFNTITNVIGGGVLNLPDAMFQASIAIGSVLCVFSSICSCFSVYTLVKACDVHRRYSMMDIWAFSLFPQAPRVQLEHAARRRAQCARTGTVDEANDAFLAQEGRNATWRDRMITLMIVCIFLYNFGCLVLYGVVIGDSLPPVVSDFFHGDGIWVEKGTWLIFGGVIFFVLSCARKMDELKWSSVLGFVTILYVVILVVVRYFTLKSDSESSAAANLDPPRNSDVKYFDVSVGVANAMSTFGLAYCYHYNVPYYYKELKDRSTKRMMLTAVYSQPVTFVCYLATGVFGYLTFGSEIDDSNAGGNVVKNYSRTDVAMNIGRFGLFFHFCCVYPILAVSCRRGLHRVLYRYILHPREVAKQQRQRQLQQQRLREQERGANGLRYDDEVSLPAAGAMVAAPSGSEGGAATDSESAIAAETAALLRHIQTELVVEDPSLPMIAGEALFIVSLSILCAWVAPGISIVVNVTGSLFGLFLMFVAPGIIGIRIFGPSGALMTVAGTEEEGDGEGSGGAGAAAGGYEYSRGRYFMSILLVVSGVVLGVTSFYSIFA